MTVFFKLMSFGRVASSSNQLELQRGPHQEPQAYPPHGTLDISLKGSHRYVTKSPIKHLLFAPKPAAKGKR